MPSTQLAFQDPNPGNDAAHSGLHLPTSMNIQDTRQVHNQPDLDSLFPGDLYYIKLAIRNNHHNSAPCQFDTQTHHCKLVQG